MVKIIGGALIALSCACMGFRLSFTLGKRVKSLSEIEASLEILESEIAFGRNKLKKAFLSADKNGIFRSASENMDNQGVQDAWRAAVNESKARLCLKEADADILIMLGERIGKTDFEDQIKSIRFIKALITEQGKQAQSEYSRLGGLCRSGGVLVGLMIVITLI